MPLPPFSFWTVLIRNSQYFNPPSKQLFIQNDEYADNGDLEWIKIKILSNLKFNLDKEDEEEKEENCEVKETKDEEKEIKTEKLSVIKPGVLCENCKGIGGCLNGKPIVYAFTGNIINHLFKL